MVRHADRFSWKDHRRAVDRPAFTLVELLVVIAIIGTLVAITLPAVNAARRAAQRSTNLNNVKQITMAILAYEEAKKAFPPLATVYNPNQERMLQIEMSKLGKDRNTSTINQALQYSYSWAFAILPHLDNQNIFDSLRNPNEQNYSLNNELAFNSPLEFYANPSRRDAAKDLMFYTGQGKGASLDYAGNGGLITPTRPPVGVLPLGIQLPNTANKSTLEEYHLRSDFNGRYSGPFHLANSKISQAMVRDGMSNTMVIGDRWMTLTPTNPQFADLPGYAGDSIATTLRYVNRDSTAQERAFPVDQLDESPFKFGGTGSTSACFGFLDGSARWIEHDVANDVLVRYSCIADGLPTNDEALPANRLVSP